MVKLRPSSFLSIIYHDKFDYPLKENELIKWRSGKKLGVSKQIDKKGEFYFLKGRENIILKRSLREGYSLKKIPRAKRIASILSKIPSIKMVGLTGSLAMMNADKLSDIDFMIITKRNTLWITRALALIFLKIVRIPIRRFNDKNEKDKICLNLWLSEANLFWKEKNVYTAHEIVQVIPLINKDKTYQNFIRKNLWTKNYWPNANLRVFPSNKNRFDFLTSILSIFDPLAYLLQYLYMRKKITKEKISKNRAVFHPIDRSLVFDFTNLREY